MRPLLLLLHFITFAGVGFAQQNHFIYIQTENKTPFSVRIEKKTFNSTSSGYLIIPKLVAKNYLLTVGFIKNQWPEQIFSININQQDEGFVLKNFEEKGWGLTNLYTLEVLNATNAGNVSQQFSNDDFSKLLSATVDDPSLRVIDLVEPAKELNTQTVSKSTSSVLDSIAKNPELVAQQLIYRNRAENSDTGYLAVYYVKNEERMDTIQVFIEKQVELVINDKIPITNVAEAIKVENNTSDTLSKIESPVISSNLTDTASDNKISNNLVDNIGSVAADNSANRVLTDSTSEQSIVKKETRRVICNAVSTDRDFYKIRAKMAAAEEDPKIINVVKKLFKEKCFNTDQIKNLSVLFLTEKGRFDFFEIAYPFVIDYENFPCLLEQINDNYYRNRLMALMQGN